MKLVRILELGIRAGSFCHIADISDKALPDLRAGADNVGSKSVELWLWLASASAKRNLGDSNPKASTEKDIVSLGQLLGLGDCEQCCTRFGKGGAVVSSHVRTIAEVLTRFANADIPPQVALYYASPQIIPLVE